MRCGYCGSRLHTEPNCPKTFGGQGNRNAMRCGYCGARNHYEAACPKTHRSDRTAVNEDLYVLDKGPR